MRSTRLRFETSEQSHPPPRPWFVLTPPPQQPNKNLALGPEGRGARLVRHDPLHVAAGQLGQPLRERVGLLSGRAPSSARDMRYLLGWAETRLAQITLTYL